MRTLHRWRDHRRHSELTVVVALSDDEAVTPGDVVMLEDVGAALVLSVRGPDARQLGLEPGERAAVLHVEAFAAANAAPDIP